MNVIDYLFSPLSKLFSTSEFKKSVQRYSAAGGDSKQVYTYTSASEGDNFQVSATASVTIVQIIQAVDVNFTITVNAGPNTVIGDRLYIMFTTADVQDENVINIPITIGFGGDINNVMCGQNQNPYGGLIKNQRLVFPFIYDGQKFTGLENC